VAALLFDLDGVLIDSEPLHLRATRAAIGAHGGSYSEQDNRTFLGMTDAESLRVLRILWNLPEPTATLVQARTSHLAALVREAQPMPGVPGVVRQLRQAGLPLGLLSASRRTVIQAALEAVGLTGCFDAIVSGEEMALGTAGPDGFGMAARRLGVAPARCLAVVDSPGGVSAARGAGMLVAAIPGRPSSHGDFSLAHLVLPGLDGLPKALESAGSGRWTSEA
jgi:HAD superfamily hydrolase (TIGR01509 family)